MRKPWKRKKIPLLVTPRLLLRPFRLSDAADVFAYASDPEVGRNAGWKPHVSLAQSRRLVRSFMESDGFVFAVTVPGEGERVVGSVGLSVDPARHLRSTVAMELGYALARDHWGKGLMTEAAFAVVKFAFSLPGVSLVTVGHYPHNQRSRRVIEKLGFTYEGTLRHASELYDGTVYEKCLYSLLKTEFAAHAKALP